MSNRPRPQANGVDLAVFAERAAFEQLLDQYRATAAEAAALGLPAELILLTARFEVLVGVVADLAGLDPERVMFGVERDAVARAREKLADAVVEVREAIAAQSPEATP